MSNPNVLLLNWNNISELNGGTEILFDHLAKMYDTKVVSAKMAGDFFKKQTPDSYYRFANKIGRAHV